jgi:hypothetical protein
MNNLVLNKLECVLYMPFDLLQLISHYAWECQECTQLKNIIYKMPNWSTFIYYECIKYDTLNVHILKNYASIQHKSQVVSYNENPLPWVEFMDKMTVNNFILSIAHNYSFKEAKHTDTYLIKNHKNNNISQINNAENMIRSAFCMKLYNH